MIPGGHDHLFVPTEQVEVERRGFIAQAETWRTRAERAEKRAEELTEAIEAAVAALAQDEPADALLLLRAALACPLCGATTEAECLGLGLEGIQ